MKLARHSNQPTHETASPCAATFLCCWGWLWGDLAGLYPGQPASRHRLAAARGGRPGTAGALRLLPGSVFPLGFTTTEPQVRSHCRNRAHHGLVTQEEEHPQNEEGEDKTPKESVDHLPKRCLATRAVELVQIKKKKRFIFGDTIVWLELHHSLVPLEGTHDDKAAGERSGARGQHGELLLLHVDVRAVCVCDVCVALLQ